MRFFLDFLTSAHVKLLISRQNACRKTLQTSSFREGPRLCEIPEGKHVFLRLKPDDVAFLLRNREILQEIAKTYRISQKLSACSWRFSRRPRKNGVYQGKYQGKSRFPRKLAQSQRNSKKTREISKKLEEIAIYLESLKDSESPWVDENDSRVFFGVQQKELLRLFKEIRVFKIRISHGFWQINKNSNKIRRNLQKCPSFPS